MPNVLGLRVIIPHLRNQSVTICGRTVPVDPYGVTAPLGEEEHRSMVQIQEIGCLAKSVHWACEVCAPEPCLEGDDLVAAVVETFDGEIVPGPQPKDFLEKWMGEDEADAEEAFKDLFDAWLDMDEMERLQTLDDLEDAKADEFLLLELFNHESRYLNSPAVIRALDTAIGRTRKPRTKEQINTQIVRNSAVGKTATKNPPAKKKGK